MSHASHAAPVAAREFHAVDARVLFHVLWATGAAGSGWDQFPPAFVAGFPGEFVAEHPEEYDDLVIEAKARFTRLADVDDAEFFVTQMVCGHPTLPRGGARP